MSIGIISHEDCLLHEMGFGHPESPERLKVISKALSKASFASELTNFKAPLASKAALKRVHKSGYIEHIFSNNPKTGYLPLDPDVLMNVPFRQARVT